MGGFPINIGKKRSFGLHLALNISILLFAIIIVAVTTFNMRYTSFYVVGDSMLDTLVGAAQGVDDDGNRYLVKGGDYVFVDRYAEPKRGDIVVIRGKDKYIIKRLIAFAGESVEIKGGYVYLNGEYYYEDYLSYLHNDPKNNDIDKRVVKDGCIFFLGDNRNVSNDSRGTEYANTKASAIVGVVTGWSMEYKDFITGWNTFFNFTLFGRDIISYN